MKSSKFQAEDLDIKYNSYSAEIIKLFDMNHYKMNGSITKMLVLNNNQSDCWE